MRAFHDQKKHLRLRDDPHNGTFGHEAEGKDVLGHSDLFATIYHPDKLPKDLEWWDEYLREATRDCEYVAQSLGVLRSVPKGAPIGILWKKARGKPLSESLPTGRLAIVFAIRVLTALQQLRDHGVIHTDLHPGNIFRSLSNRPTVIDMMCYSTPVPVGCPGGKMMKRESEVVNDDYIAPELKVIGNSTEHTAKTLDHSAYTIAYYILKKGNLPFEVRNTHGVLLSNYELESAKLYGRFGTQIEGYSAPDDGIRWRSFSDEVSWLFDQAFRRGRVVPDVRPTLDELIIALKKWRRIVYWKTLGYIGAALIPVMFVAGLYIGRGECPVVLKPPIPRDNSPPPRQEVSVPPPIPSADHPLIAPVFARPRTVPLPPPIPQEPQEEINDERPALWRGKR